MRLIACTLTCEIQACLCISSIVDATRFCIVSMLANHLVWTWWLAILRVVMSSLLWRHAWIFIFLTFIRISYRNSLNLRALPSILIGIVDLIIWSFLLEYNWITSFLKRRLRRLQTTILMAQASKLFLRGIGSHRIDRVILRSLICSGRITLLLLKAVLRLVILSKFVWPKRASCRKSLYIR